MSSNAATKRTKGASLRFPSRRACSCFFPSVFLVASEQLQLAYSTTVQDCMRNILNATPIQRWSSGKKRRARPGFDQQRRFPHLIYHAGRMARALKSATTYTGNHVSTCNPLRNLSPALRTRSSHLVTSSGAQGALRKPQL